MAPFYLFLVLVIQCSFIHGETEVSEDKVPDEPRDQLQKPAELEEDAFKGFQTQKDWLDMFISTSGNMFQSPSATMMSQITNSNKTLDEQLLEIKALAKQISEFLETEMVSVFEYAMNAEKTDNANRKRRSADPMDSTALVMRLLKHIKSNNEYQNVAIDKMMSAQEIAEKFGIEFTPDPEILSDLAVAAHEQTQEMASLLKSACDLKNVTTTKAAPEPVNKDTKTSYSKSAEKQDLPPYEFLPDIVSKPKTPVTHFHYAESLPMLSFPFESQIPSPPHHHHSSPKPSNYEPFLSTYSFSPASDFFYLEPVTTTVLVPVEETEPEPELVGEEVVESVTSKMVVERGEEPGSSTVNHVTTYTLSEKSHYKTPEIEKLPQQFQYSFYLM